MVLAHCQVIIVNVTLLSYDSKVEKLVVQSQLRFTAHDIFCYRDFKRRNATTPERNRCNLYHFSVVFFFRFGLPKGYQVQATLSDITYVTDHPGCSSSFYCKFLTYGTFRSLRILWNVSVLSRPEDPELDLSEQGREPTTHSTQMASTLGFEPRPHCLKASALSTAPPLLNSI